MENLNEHTHIVFGAEHYNPLGIVRSLGEAGINSVGVILRGKRKITSASRYFSKIHYVDSMDEGLKVILDSYATDSSLKPFVYTADDTVTSFLDLKYDKLKDKIQFFNAGKAGRITEFMNKKVILDIAKKHGLNVIDSITIHKNSTMTGGGIDNLAYPVITKAISPTKENWKGDSFVCQTKEELQEVLETIQSEDILVQHFINKKNEYCIDGISVANGTQVFYAIASTYNYILQNFYSFDMNVTNFDRFDLKDKLDAIFSEIGFEGIFSVEFLIDQDDTFYFTEINFRNSTWSYFSTCAGMNLPLLWSESMVSGKIPDNAQKKVPQPFRAVVELSDFKRRVLAGKENIFTWIRKISKAQCLILYNRKDPKPFWSYFFS